MLIEARYTRDRRAALDRATMSLEYVRHLVRLSRDLTAMMAIDRIERHTGKDRAAFDRDEMLQIWMVHHLLDHR